MSDETDVTGEVARVLGEHAGWSWHRVENQAASEARCTCGHVLRSGIGRLNERLRDHQAAMLAEAGLLRDQATIDALNERCRILVDEADAFRNDLTNLREDLMERVGCYTPSDADLLAYVDALKAQIAAQEPAGEPGTRSGGSRTSGGLDGAPVDAWPFAPGDVVLDSGEDSDHVAWLDAAPQRTVLVDSQGSEWIRLGDGWFLTDRSTTSRWASVNLEQTYGPLSVVSVGKATP